MENTLHNTHAKRQNKTLKSSENTIKKLTCIMHESCRCDTNFEYLPHQGP